MSEEDRHNGALPDVRERFILQSSRELIDELERLDEIARQKTETKEPTLPTAPKGAMPAVPVVLGLPARDAADELIAYMLVHLLRRRGITAAVTPLSAPLDEAFKNADRAEVKASFISALPPSAVGAARQMCRRLKLHASSTPILVGIWSPRADQEELEKRLHASQPTKVVTRLADAVTQLEAMVTGRSAQSPQEPTPVAPESDRKLTRQDKDSHTPFEPAT
jgi:hypothetical protein